MFEEKTLQITHGFGAITTSERQRSQFDERIGRTRRSFMIHDDGE
jgi:hypothetical protein